MYMCSEKELAAVFGIIISFIWWQQNEKLKIHSVVGLPGQGTPVVGKITSIKGLFTVKLDIVQITNLLK